MKRILCLAIIVITFLSIITSCVKDVVTPEVMIYEVYTAGGYFSGQNFSPYQNSYAVLYNSAAESVSLNGWRLLSCNAQGHVISERSIKLSGTIEPGAFFVVKGGKATDAYPNHVGEALPFNIDLDNSSFSPERRDGAIVLSRSNKSGTPTPTAKGIEDYLAYGTALDPQAVTASDPSLKTVLRRDSFVNTSDNATDFKRKNIVDRPANIIRYIHGLTRQSMESMNFQIDADILQSHEQGQYTSGFDLTLTTTLTGNTKIYYTLDGSAPISPLGKISERAIEYTAPIPIRDSSKEPAKQISAVDAQQMYTWLPIQGLEELDADYLERINEIYNSTYKANIVRVAAVNDESIVTPTNSSTFFITDKSLQERYNMPVISVITDPLYVFDRQTGIFVGENVWSKDFTSHVPSLIQYFEKSGETIFVDTARLQVHGNTSRTVPQTAMRITMGNNNVDYDLFDGKALNSNNEPITNFDRFILRQGGSEWYYGGLRDAFWQRYCASLGTFGVQATRPATVFVNGIYWGTYFMTERHDKDYITAHYGVPSNDVAMIDFHNNPAELREGTDDDLKELVALRDFVIKNDMSSAANYQHFTDAFDVDSYIDYFLCEIYSLNEDWPENNIRVWKNRNPDATEHKKWTMLMCDLDSAFWNGMDYYLDALLNKNEDLSVNSKMFTSLMKNNDFRTQFITRGEYLLDNFFKTDEIIKSFRGLQQEVSPALSEHTARWRHNTYDYTWTGDSIVNIVSGRNNTMRNELNKLK